MIDLVKEKGAEQAANIFRQDLTNPELSKQVEKLYLEVGLRHARRNEIRLRDEIRRSAKAIGHSQVWIDFIKNYLRIFLTSKITFSVNETTRDALLKVLDKAIQEGWGLTKIVDKLESLPLTENQAARIVRTEVNRASNVGAYAQGNSFEYELQKGWISVHDNRTRGRDPNDHADHFHLDGQWVDFYDVFRDPRNGHTLQHPGDPEAEPEDTVFCRCSMTTRPKRDVNGKLIPKESRISVIRNFNRPQRTITI